MRRRTTQGTNWVYRLHSVNEPTGLAATATQTNTTQPMIKQSCRRREAEVNPFALNTIPTLAGIK
ncbi:Hypothetical predicted protein, partial [Lynx pardinus]